MFAFHKLKCQVELFTHSHLLKTGFYIVHMNCNFLPAFPQFFFCILNSEQLSYWLLNPSHGRSQIGYTVQSLNLTEDILESMGVLYFWNER